MNRESLDNWMWQREFRYTKRMHPTKPRYWVKAKYFGKLNFERADNWVFGDKQSRMFLQKFSWFPIDIIGNRVKSSKLIKCW